MNVVNLNLCTELVKEMERLNFSEASIAQIKSNPHYVEAFNKPDMVQRSMLTMTLYGILLGRNIPAPAHIRLALNTSKDVVGWLDDMKLVILPFLKENEEAFF